MQRPRRRSPRPAPRHCSRVIAPHRDWAWWWRASNPAEHVFIFTLADSAFAFACNTHNRVTVAQAAKIDFLRPARRGDELHAEAREISRSARSGLYDVEVRRADGELVACFRGNSHSSDKHLVEDHR